MSPKIRNISVTQMSVQIYMHWIKKIVGYIDDGEICKITNVLHLINGNKYEISRIQFNNSIFCWVFAVFYPFNWISILLISIKIFIYAKYISKSYWIPWVSLFFTNIFWMDPYDFPSIPYDLLSIYVCRINVRKYLRKCAVLYLLPCVCVL